MAEGASSGFVLDASALLAWVHGEPGGGQVRAAAPRSTISAVNWSEVVQKASAAGLPFEEKRDELLDVGLRIVAFDREDAEGAAAIWPVASSLSLADRACLALASRLGLPALTADRAWANLNLDLEIRLIR